MIRYYTTGQGKAILFIHGYGVSFTVWRYLSPLITKGHMLIFAELPGHGTSRLPQKNSNYYQYSASCLEKLRKKVGISSWSIVSYSAGTRVSEAYALKYGSRIDCSVYIFPLVISQTKALLLKCALNISKQLTGIDNWILTKWRLGWLIRTIGFNGKNHPEVKKWQMLMSNQPPRVLRKMINDLPMYGTNNIKKIPVPTIYIWGKRDRITTKIYSSKDIVINCSHAGIVTHSKELSTVINKFIR